MNDDIMVPLFLHLLAGAIFLCICFFGVHFIIKGTNTKSSDKQPQIVHQAPVQQDSNVIVIEGRKYVLEERK